MTIEEAIKHCEEVAEANERTCKAKPNVNLEKYIECSAEHRQIAEWLKELKFYRNLFDSLKKDFENKLLYGEVGESE